MPRSQVELLRAACCIAGLDREICEKERPLLEALAHEAGVGRASLEAMLSRAKNDPNFYREMFLVLQKDAEAALKLMFDVAAANQEITLEQRVILQHFADQLGVPRERCDELLAAAEKQDQS
ncbi:hypothetical protein ACERK3_03845 [Phycisphaerales bacterium AB-hyl4]|uniref:Co-chaperone DjlA N-terminal domain-containing protein n=1 Tax=Natronomicrosphaera hydrolytica TaxID=3242702 RepID=A0ABV4U3E9_9BACT